MKNLVLAVVGLLVLSVAVAGYVRVGWWRMESACSRDDSASSRHDSVSYDWSWQPLGFQCTYGDGTGETSLWF